MHISNTSGRNWELDEIIERIGILRKQDETVYRCVDYLSHEYQARQSQSNVKDCAIQSSLFRSARGDWDSSSSQNSDSVATSMTVAWRDKICEWYYTIADYFNYERELVYVCMNNLDRYAMRRSVDTRTYQLAAIASLFIVVKTYEPSTSNRRIDVAALSKLSQNVFDENCILAMESEMLQTLEWYLFPPTSYTFAQNFCSLLFAVPQDLTCPQISKRVMNEVKDLSRFLTELSVCDYFFVTHCSSTIGLASLLNAIDFVSEKVDLCNDFPHELVQAYTERIFYFTGLNAFSPEVQECRSRLRETYIQGGFYQGQIQGATSESMDYNASHEQPSRNKSAVTDNVIETTDTEHDTEQVIVVCIPSPVCVSGATE